mgnify:FL=1|tara:strand:+ start:616 stop:1137 length:522 start_codon:yes stop_codon:yes gene_type:complete
MKCFLLFTAINIITTCNSFGEIFFRYTSRQLVNKFRPSIDYTSDKIRKYEYGSQDRNYWVSSNRNLHKALKYAKLRDDKCLYLGWIPNTNPKIANLAEADYPYIFVFLDIESQNILRLTHIIQNPCIQIKMDLGIFKKDLQEFTDNIGIYLDISQLKDFDDGRWYLDFIHSRS